MNDARSRKATAGRYARLFRNITVYLGSAWVLLEASGYFQNRFQYSQSYDDAVFVWLSFGLGGVIIHEIARLFTLNPWKTPIILVTQAIVAGSALYISVPYLLRPDQPRYSYYDNSGRDISVAVMPFRDISPGAQAAWLIEGINEHIINKLSTLQSLDVKSSSATNYFKGKDYSLPEVADVLGVNNILEGTLQYFDSLISVSVRLTQPQTGSLIWSETLNYRNAELIALQTDIAERVVQKLNSEVNNSRLKELGDVGTSNAEAYELYLRGKHYYRQMNYESTQKARECFEKAIELDPEYVGAINWLAEVYLMWGGRWFGIYPDSAFSVIRKLIDRSMEIEPDNPETRFIRAESMFFYDRNYEEATRIAKSVFNEMEDKENHILLFSFMLVFTEQPDVSIEMLQNYVRSNPTSAEGHLTLGHAYLFVDQFEKTVEHVQKAMELNPYNPQAVYYMAEAYSSQEQYDKSILLWESLYNMFKEPTWLEGYFRTLYRNGNVEKAMEIYHELEMINEISPVPYSYVLAKATATLGDVDKTIRYLEEAYETHEIEVVSLIREHGFDGIRDDPKFAAIMKKFGRDHTWYRVPESYKVGK